eukprot:ctg_4564.g663
MIGTDASMIRRSALATEVSVRERVNSHSLAVSRVMLSLGKRCKVRGAPSTTIPLLPAGGRATVVEAKAAPSGHAAAPFMSAGDGETRACTDWVGVPYRSEGVFLTSPLGG